MFAVVQCCGRGTRPAQREDEATRTRPPSPTPRGPRRSATGRPAGWRRLAAAASAATRTARSAPRGRRGRRRPRAGTRPARSAICASLYWSTAWLATSTAWLLASTWRLLGHEEVASSACVVACASCSEQSQPPLGVVPRWPQLAHLRGEGLGARLQVVGVMAHDERRARGAERDDEQDHGGDEQGGALAPRTAGAARAESLTGGVMPRSTGSR